MSQPNDAAETPSESHNQGTPINPDVMPDMHSQAASESHPSGDVIPGQPMPSDNLLSTLASSPYVGSTSIIPVQSAQDPGSVATLASPEHRTSALIQPLPLLALLALEAAITLALVGVLLTGTDWAAGVVRMANIAAIFALVIGLVAGVRSIGGMARLSNPFRRVQYTGVAVLAAVLLVISGLSYGLQAPIHRIQAHSLETNQQWSAALDEYGLAGEAAPVSEDLARVQNEWGESQNKAQKFDSAITTYNQVLTSFTSAPIGLKRAQAGTVTAYFNAGLLATANKQYVQAMQSYDALLNLPFCEKTCQAETNRLDATTYYHVAEVALAAQDYSTATTAFNTITTRFASAPEASMIHVDYAKALLGLGRKLVASSSCSDALGTYQAITKNFADTASGKQAAIDLLAPQAVKGQFTTTPATGVIVYVDLITNLKIDAQGSILSADNVAYAQVKSDGSFTFDAVPLGTYPLEWFTYDSAGNAKTGSYYVFKGTSNPYYVANVQPLCPFDFGQIASPIVGPPLAKVTGAPMTLTAAPFSAHRLPFALQPVVLTTMRNVSFALPTLR